MANVPTGHPKIRRRTAIQAGAVGILGMGMNHLGALRQVAAAGPDLPSDNRGKAKQNLKLSEKRAKAVVKYLVKKGIAKNRLEGRGYGDARPVQSNDTKEGRDKNRRVEFLFVERAEEDGGGVAPVGNVTDAGG